MQRESNTVDPARYDADYFERGPVLGISGYSNYSWMPELTLRMAHKLIMALGIREGERVLDYGCAKGFLVKAMRILDVPAFGVDVSAYAISQADGEVREYCRLVSGTSDPALFRGERYDWMLAKDVFEHLTEEDLKTLLTSAREVVGKMFVAVPLAPDDQCEKYVIPEYERDVTHVLRKSLAWWKRIFESHGWQVDVAAFRFPGCKENWTSHWPEGNGFFVLSRGVGR